MRVTYVDLETGLPAEAAERVKAKIKALEDENARLRQENEELKQKVSSLEEENEKLRMSVKELRTFYETQLDDVRKQLDDVRLEVQAVKAGKNSTLETL